MLMVVIQDCRYRQAAKVGGCARGSLLPGLPVEVLQESSSYYAADGWEHTMTQSIHRA